GAAGEIDCAHMTLHLDNPGCRHTAGRLLYPVASFAKDTRIAFCPGCRCAACQRREQSPCLKPLLQFFSFNTVITSYSMSCRFARTRRDSVRMYGSLSCDASAANAWRTLLSTLTLSSSAIACDRTPGLVSFINASSTASRTRRSSFT